MIRVASTWRFLIEEALRQTVIIFALSHHSLWGQTHYEVQAERQRKVFLLSSTRDLYTSRLSSLSEWARSVWWSAMSLAFSGYYMYLTVWPHNRSSSLIQDAKRYYVEVNIAAMIAPNQGHPAEGYRGDTDTLRAHLHKCNFPPSPLTQGDQAHNSETHVRWSWWTCRSREWLALKQSCQSMQKKSFFKKLWAQTEEQSNYFAWPELKIICLSYRKPELQSKYWYCINSQLDDFHRVSSGDESNVKI